MKYKKINDRFLKTTKDGYYPHFHYIELDENGNGRTVDTLSGPTHSHTIIKFYVEKDGDHNHDVSFETKELLSQVKKGK